MKRLVSIGVIWMCCAFAWMVLGSTIVYRSGDTSSVLTREVGRLWGDPIVQNAPRAYALPFQDEAAEEKAKTEETPPQTSQTDAQGRTIAVAQPVKPATPGEALPLEATDVDVTLDLEHRKKGLVWFATYGTTFDGRYTFKNNLSEARNVLLTFPLPGLGRVYDGFKVVGEDGKVIDAEIVGTDVQWKAPFEPGEERSYRVVYASRGTESWSYGNANGLGGAAAKVKDFNLDVTTNFGKVDFPAQSLSPSSHASEGQGWKGAWHFDSLLTGSSIGITLPTKLNPGPLASKITFFAPVSLLFFFFVVAILAAARGKDIHPMNYFLLACAFFAFHLLFAYLVDHLSVSISFATSALMSVALVTSYARLFVGWRFALVEIGVAQLIYLVLFSFTFFWSGFTGLSITVGAIATLFVIMQITGRIDWAQAAPWAKQDAPPPEGPSTPPDAPMPPPQVPDLESVAVG